MKNYYNILGITKNASKEEIKKAYRNLALKFHPDRNDDEDLSDVFKFINEAKQVLLNDEKRAEYDAILLEKGTAGNVFDDLKSFSGRAPHFGNYPGQNRYFRNSAVRKRPVFIIALLAFIAVAGVFFFSELDDRPSTGLAVSNETPVIIPSDISKEVTDIPPLNPPKQESIQNKTYIVNPAKKVAVTENANKKAAVPAHLELRKPQIKKTVIIINKKEEVKPAAIRGKSAKTVLVNNNKANDNKPVAEPVAAIAEKQLSQREMSEILLNINKEKASLGSKSRCVQIRKTKTSNASNGFKLADFLKSNGFIISGRETISTDSKGIIIEANGDCLRVTIGTI